MEDTSVSLIPVSCPFAKTFLLHWQTHIHRKLLSSLRIYPKGCNSSSGYHFYSLRSTRMLSLGVSTFDLYKRPSALKFALLLLQQNLSLLFFNVSYVVNMWSLKKKNKLEPQRHFLRSITNIAGIHCSFLKLCNCLLWGISEHIRASQNTILYVRIQCLARKHLNKQ